MMSVQERRRRSRNHAEFSDTAYIEIRHTFGPIRKSVYRVVEYNESGISFLVPVSDGYFGPGFPLNYCLVKFDRTKIESFGEVKYYHPYNDHQGNSFYKIGVENNQLSGTHPVKLKIRPERYNLTALQSVHAIFFSLDAKEFELPLVDISRYSAAFHCSEEDALGMQVSSTIEAVAIVFGKRTIFEGTIIVTRRTEEGDQYRIVVEPRNAIFNIEAIDEEENLTSVARCVGTLISESDKYAHIDDHFKATVADMRMFLEGYKKTLDTPMAIKLSKETDPTLFLNELNKTFYSQLDRYWAKVDKVVGALNLNDQDHGLYKAYLQKHLHPLMMASPFCHRIYFKPLGYPGDYEMIRMLTDNSYEGPTLFSKLVNHHALQNPLAVAARIRNDILADRIGAFVKARGGREVRLLSIASGPALEIQKLIKESPEIADKIHITLVDHEAEALRYSQDSIYMKRIVNNCNIRVELIHQTIGSFLMKRVAKGSASFSRYDMIYAFGLFDYFDDRTCSFCINNSATLLDNDGMMLISNYSLDGHHHRTYMEYAYDWYIVYRNREQLEQLGRTTTRPCTVSVDEDPSGIVKFLELRYGANH